MLNRFPHMVQEFYVARVRQLEESREARKAAIQTPQQAEQYLTETRARIAECFGPLPPRTPLEPQITGVLERDAYRVEKVLLESRPEFYVTANLYVPKGRAFPLPGVVGTCGHSKEGKGAAVLDDRVHRVTLKNALTSFAEIAESETYSWPLSALLPHVLKHYDLTDCYAELSQRKSLSMLEPWGADGFRYG